MRNAIIVSMLCSVLVGCGVEETGAHAVWLNTPDAGDGCPIVCDPAGGFTADGCCAAGDPPPAPATQRQEVSMSGAAGRAPSAVYVSGGKLLTTAPTQVTYSPQLTVGARVVGVTLRLRGNGGPSIWNARVLHVAPDDLTAILSAVSIAYLPSASTDIIMPMVPALFTAGSSVSVEFEADPGVEITNVRFLLE
jgi:hypothetical protein